MSSQTIRTEALSIVGPVMGEHETALKIYDLLLREREFPIKVEHLMPSGGVQVLQLTIAQIRDKKIELGAHLVEPRYGSGLGWREVFAYKFSAMIYYLEPHNAVPATIFFHWENAGGRPDLLGSVQIWELERPKLVLPSDGPLP